MQIHVCNVLRAYLGLNQGELSRLAGITQCDLSEIENHEPFGGTEKYRRVAEVLKVPIQALATNDFKAIPMSFFDAHPAPKYKPLVKKKAQMIGRAGEEEALRMEQERLREIYPALAKLVLPHYKMDWPSPGYDILSFDDDGNPICIEVKTTTNRRDTPFTLTVRENTRAKVLTASGIPYLVYRYSGWGTSARMLDVIPFEEFKRGIQVTPAYFTCSYKRPELLSGIAYYRQMRDIQQGTLARELGVTQQLLSDYERGVKNCPIKHYIKLSELLDATIDELVEHYKPEDLSYGQ